MTESVFRAKVTVGVFLTMFSCVYIYNTKKKYSLIKNYIYDISCLCT